MLSSIPETKRASVLAGLKSAFGARDFDAPPTVLVGGLSGAAVLKIRVGGIAYVLRIEGPLGPFTDLASAYACMRLAAQALLAPRVWYADPEAGVAIIDLVDQQPLSQFEGGRETLLGELARTLRVLHQSPMFPRSLDVLDGVDAFIDRSTLSRVLDPAQNKELFARYDGLRRDYRTCEADRVSSHLDLNPGNIIHDGRRLWLIDWYSAFAADRYSDLASLVNWFAADEVDAARLSETYFGAPLDDDQAARLFLMRQANHLFLGATFLQRADEERPGTLVASDLDEGPNLADLRRRLATGAFDMASWENRAAYGEARLAEAFRGLRSATFGEALGRLAA